MSDTSIHSAPTPTQPTVAANRATHRINVLDLDGRPQIWLDTEIAECDGICLGSGNTLAAAKADALEELAAALAHVDAINPDVHPTLPREWTREAKRRRALNNAAPDLTEALVAFVALYEGFPRDAFGPRLAQAIALAEAALAKVGIRDMQEVG